jgi:hypothetical protein
VSERPGITEDYYWLSAKRAMSRNLENIMSLMKFDAEINLNNICKE